MVKKVFAVLVLVIIMLLLTGCNNVFKTDTPSLEEKVDEEVEYLDSEIISMINSLNGIIYTNYKVIPTEVKQTNTASNPNSQMNESGATQSSGQKSGLETSGEANQGSSGANSQSSGKSSEGESNQTSGESLSGAVGQNSGGKASSSNQIENKSNVITLKMEPNTILSLNNVSIDWNKNKSNIEILYTAWITARMDMKELGVSDDLLNQFSAELNNTIIAMKNEDKIETMDSLANMYSVLYELINSYCDDRFKICTIEAKKYTLKSYNYIENEKWEEASNQLVEAKQKFENIKNFGDIEEKKKVDIERVNVLIKEMKDSLELHDREVALLKYKDLIQELSIL